MNDREPPRLTRRELGTGFLRTAALGGLTLLSAVLLRRGDAGPRNSCRRTIACRQCPVLAGCGLPKAAATRAQTSR